ncbi:MAG TPA: rhodanese-related sulfurtransferase [Cyclobacteriaceae bacterium]
MHYYILLYYCYTDIDDPEDFRESHHLFCIAHDLKGRIIVASEGINGTISGLKENCGIYMDVMKNDPRFQGIDFKIEPAADHAFKKLNVRVKPEIVHSSLSHIDPRKKAGRYIEPSEFKEILKNKDEDTVIFDVRSNYEHLVGRFKNAKTMDIENFRDFPEKVKALEAYKDKKIITYCTGGVKCEKASSFLLENGFENVYQLHGGIIKYGIEEKGEDFEGKCYVFDNRVVAEVNKVNPSVISRCYVTGDPCDRMVNCANPHCNKHIPLSEEGAKKYDGCCSEECMNNPDARPYNGTGYYQKELNGYNPYRGAKRKSKDQEVA